MLRAALLALFALTVPAGAQTKVDNPPDPYVHKQTGFRFPTQLGPFVRREVDRYSPDGADTGVGYDLIAEGTKVGYVSVFVYPVPADAMTPSDKGRAAACRTLFDGIKADIFGNGNKAVFEEESEVAAPSPIFHATGWRATFTGTGPLGSQEPRPIKDAAYLYCHAGQRWLVAYRATWRRERDATAEVAAFMTALTWPDSLKR